MKLEFYCHQDKGPPEARGKAYNRSSPNAFRGTVALPKQLTLGPLLTRTGKQYIFAVKSTQFMILYYSSPRKLI